MDAADAPPLSHQLVRLHLQISALYESSSRALDLTPRQAQVLCVVANEGPSLRQLAERANTTGTNITGLVDRLVDRGLLAREADPDDRRVTRVVVTADGQEAVAAFHAQLSDPFSALCLDDPDTTVAVLAELNRAVEALRPPCDG